MINNSYNPLRKDRAKSFNSHPTVFTETAEDIQPEDREKALENLNSLIKKTYEELSEE
jgi:L-lactate utilization protein LutB